MHVNGSSARPLFGSHLSPDPLVNSTWPHGTPGDRLQLYTVWPTAVSTDAPGSFANLDSIVGGGGDYGVSVGDGGSGSRNAARVLGAGSFRVDFGAEFAGWIELESADIPDAAVRGLWLGVSEDGEPRPGKTRHPVRHPTVQRMRGNIFRLETNWLIYEGVRFGFVTVGAQDASTSNDSMTASVQPWHILSVRGVAQALPVEYASSFEAPSDNELSGVAL